MLRKSIFSILAALLTSFASNATPARLMQGPMVGAVDQDSARIWARAAGPVEVSIRYSSHASFTDAITTAPVRAKSENDYCVEIELSDLNPSSFYYYQILLDGQPLDSVKERDGYPILTAPADNVLTSFSVGFGSGARADIDGLQAIWLQVQNARPHAFFWLGENESFGGMSPEFQAELYRKQRGVPFLQPLLRSIPQLSTWDAPIALNDSNRDEALEIFQRYWANPSYGNDKAPGSYFKHAYGGVDFFFLDTLSYRDESKQSTMLGKTQLSWLKKELNKSEATFKVLLSGSSWTNATAGGNNTWIAYEQERNELFKHIQDKEIPGVLLISGDDDEAEIKAIPMSRDGGYDLYELVSSPLAQDPQPTYEEDNSAVISIEEPYAESMNFGMLSFDLTIEDPTVTLDIINVFGESVFPRFTVKASDLSNGVSSWKSKVPAESVAALEARSLAN